MSVRKNLPKEPKQAWIHEINMIEASNDPSVEVCWIQPIVDYLENSTLSKDKVKVRKMRLKDARYTMIKGALFRKYFYGLLLICVSEEDPIIVL